MSVLLDYAGNCKGLTFLGLALSAVAMILGMTPYLCIWLAVRDLIAAVVSVAAMASMMTGSPAELLAKPGGLFRHMTKLQAESAGWSVG